MTFAFEGPQLFRLAARQFCWRHNHHPQMQDRSTIAGIGERQHLDIRVARRAISAQVDAHEGCASVTISGWRGSDTAGETTITSACAPKIATAR